MDKYQSYYENRKKYGDICIPRRENLLNYLIKEHYLSEFKTEEEKTQVLENLGIIKRLDNIIYITDILSDLLNNYITEEEFNQRLWELREQLKPKDEKSKGYYSSYEELIQENPTNSIGDWAIVNVEGTWYIYKYSSQGWERSEIYDNQIDLSGYTTTEDLLTLLERKQTKLISGTTIKTINGQSILGPGDLQVQGVGGGGSDEYLTKEEFYNIQYPLKVYVSVSPNLAEFTGSPKEVTVSFTAKKGDGIVTPSSISLSYKGQEQEITGPTTITLQESGITTFTVTCQYKSETSSGIASTNLVMPTYIGFSQEENANNIDLTSLQKKVVANLTMHEALENNVAGNYLWIITPHTLQNVATDQGFTYLVKMNIVDSFMGLNCYRSSSKIDISNITYYIK